MITREALLEHLGAQTYDKNYQAIKCLGMNGYSHSKKTWARIQGLADWSGSTVVDLGCFHGYFSFRAEEAGAAKVIGLDAHEPAIVTARMIGELEGHSVSGFHHWNDVDPTPPSDIVLCLNALHHFKEPEACLAGLDTKIAIFEAPVSQIGLIETAFEIKSQNNSHRRKRAIFVAEKK